MAQSRYDYQWILGYDQGIGPGDEAILLNFNQDPVEISLISSVYDFGIEGSNTSMCNKDGNLLFYSNGCYIVNAKGNIMDNGDRINPGLAQNIWCTAGGVPTPQGILSIPSPGKNNLYYIFNLDIGQPYLGIDSFLGIAPEKLYYHVIDISQNGGLGKVILKNQIAIQDTFARANISAVQHANGKDWWIIVPKSHTNCYFVTLVNEQGVHASNLECQGRVFNDFDLQGQATFSPNGKKYVRFLPRNGLNIYDFDNQTGSFSNSLTIEFPGDTSHIAGVAISPNSRFLYASFLKKLYQFDLQSANITSSKTLIGEWDGFSNPYPTIFDLMALAPDNRIYIAGTSSHKYLHVINKPDCPGLQCEFKQRGVNLPSYNYSSMPNLPHYRNRPSNVSCDSIVNSIEINLISVEIKINPNPVYERIIIEIDQGLGDIYLAILDISGRIRYERNLQIGPNIINVDNLENGLYIIKFKTKSHKVQIKKILKIN